MEPKEAVAKEKKQEELGLWKEWKKSGSQKTLGQLLTSFAPVIQQTVKKFETVPLPHSAISAEAKKQAIQAFKTYDPGAGAALGTHVTNYMKKVNRFVYEHQNIGRIPEHRVTQIGTYQAVKSELKDKKGREPSAAELADELMWSLPEIERMEVELRREVPETAVEDVDFTFTSQNDAQRILGFIYYELSPQEKIVFEYLTGWAGKPKLDDAEVAVRAGITRERVKKLKAQIAAKIKARMP